jgi:hypothetical protein
MICNMKSRLKKLESKKKPSKKDQSLVKKHKKKTRANPS